jgi:hypothetical protein
MLQQRRRDNHTNHHKRNNPHWPNWRSIVLTYRRAKSEIPGHWFTPRIGNLTQRGLRRSSEPAFAHRVPAKVLQRGAQDRGKECDQHRRKQRDLHRVQMEAVSSFENVVRCNPHFIWSILNHRWSRRRWFLL